MNQTSSNALAAIGLIVLTLLAALGLAERAGLPLEWVRHGVNGLGILGVIGCIWLTRTAVEKWFHPSGTVLPPLMAGTLIAVVANPLADRLVSATDGKTWLAARCGVILGVLAAMAVLRWARKRERTAGSQHRQPLAAGLLSGAAGLILGSALLLTLASPAAEEIARLLGVGPAAALALAFLPPLLAMLAGGGLASATFAGALAIVAAGAIAAGFGLGAMQLGQPPLPGFAEAQTLAAMAQARAAWSITEPLLPMAWPALASLAEPASLAAMGIAALMTAGLVIAATPALPGHRRGFAALAALAAAVIPVAVIAVAGYAVEAAAIRFVGAPIARPPQAMIDASRLGLISICGAFPDTADAIRAACGVGPRDAAAFSWNQIGLTQAYVAQGPMASLGHAATITLAGSVAKLAGCLAGLSLGLWLAAEGVGHGLLGRRLGAAGLASLRLGLTRLAALAIAVGALALPAMQLRAMIEWLPGTAAGAGALLLLLTLALPLLQRPAPPSAEAEKPPARRRKPSATVSSAPAPSTPAEAAQQGGAA